MHILVINSSASGDASVSRILVDEAVQRLLEANPGAGVTYRDVGDTPIAHLTSETLAGVRAEAETDAEHRTRQLSDTLIAEISEADLIVMGAPMYNFSIPSGLRTWFDHILRPRVTFRYTEAGPEGLLTGKRAIVVEARGGFYSQGAAKAFDFQEGYLTTLLGLVGIKDVTFILAERIGFGPDARDAAIADAKDQIARWLNQPEAELASAQEVLDPEALLLANLERVFGERDAGRRLDAIASIYQDDAILHESGHSVQGHAEISQVVTDLLGRLPPTFAFAPIRPPVSHNGLARLQWRVGAPGEAPAVTGTDVASFENGRIRSLHVFLDHPGT